MERISSEVRELLALQQPHFCAEWNTSHSPELPSSNIHARAWAQAALPASTVAGEGGDTSQRYPSTPHHPSAGPFPPSARTPQLRTLPGDAAPFPRSPPAS